ncbi:CusA/CzcA family heavy metal efflux RND transporter [Catalinimonas niigatensis]|uniref:CusA/CzcA family heavy metal efflux RND transporter n=1 Tax=Catalinimonas niigatensis TaxID=1397264 RepID=UPI0026650922|nr:CusA/CzcA family heavy metal efflux RND transporter [Catalinimonas niigatensis]WPP49551.1 CusA/CzcA family heavy metal efflux RND transporter [Catalinimonas niigatensis]
MFEKIIDLSVNNKFIIMLMVLSLVGFGIYSMNELPIDAVPDITNNQVQVVTVSQSLAPQEVEQLITYPIEISMANIPDVTEIRSISRYGLSVVTIVFEEHVPTMLARQYVGEQINMATDEIPSELGKPELMPITTGLGELYQYTLEVDEGYEDQYDAMSLRTIQDWIVKRQLSGISGIVEVSSFGGFLKQYEVALDPARLKSHSLTIADVFSALETNNQNSGGSYIEKNSNAYYIRAEGLISQIQDIENIVIDVRNGLPILVKHVAEVRFGSAKRFGAMTKNGKGEAVGGITLMFKGANSSDAIDNVHQRIAQVQKSLPEGVKIVPYLDRSDLVARTITTVRNNLVEGGLIVIFVLVLLLGNFRAGLIVASVIPLSMLFAFIMMRAFGVSANLMSLGAIDFGIVVDGAVIIVESVLHVLYTQYLGRKLSRSEMNSVVSHATSQIFKSAAFGVLIIIVVFIPIMTLTGIEGKMFRPMAQTVSFAVLGALLLSLTYVPMMASWVLKRDIQDKKTISDKIVDGLKKVYLPVLDKAIQYKKTVVTVAFILFLISAFSFTRLGGEFIPTLEEGDLAMQMTIQPGSSLEESVKTSSKAEKILLDNFPEVEQVISKIGTAEVPTDPMAIEDGDIMIIMKDKAEWVSAETREELVAMMKEKLDVIAGANFDFTQPIQLRFNELISGVKTDIAVKIYGEDMNELFAKANEAADLISGISGAADIKVEQVEGLPQLMIRYDRQKIAQYGLNIEELNTLIRAAYAGEPAGVIFEGERKFDMVVRLNETNRQNVNLEQLYVNNGYGMHLPVSQVARVEYEEGPMQISREDTKRRVTIGINVRNRDIESLVGEIQQKLEAGLSLQPGYYIGYGGDFENLQAAKARLSIAVPIALLLILILLYFTFGSVKYAILIFTAVPLSAIGGITALWIRDMPFSISAGVGFIALFGVAVLNGIVLISYFNQLREEGMTNLREVVITGGLARLRPVIMTAAVASLGFLPMALSNTSGAEVQKPLATVVIGGLITATLLTLIVLPILYILFNQPPRINKAMLSILLVLGFPLLSQAQDDPMRLSLEQALETGLENHPSVSNAALDIVSAKKMKGSILDLPATEFTYQYGQINSNLKDPMWQINQSFGSLLSHPQRNKYVNQQISLNETELALAERKLERDMKSAYYQWVYERELWKQRKQELELYTDYSQKVSLRYESGDSDLLEKTLSETQYSSARHALEKQRDQVHIAENILKQLMYYKDSGQLIPATDTLTVIDFQAESLANPENSPLVDKSKKEVSLSQSVEKLEKSRLFPELSVGYFNQNISDREVRLKNLQGWQVGVAIPLWFFPQKSRISQARIQQQQALNRMEYMQYNVQQEVDKLLLQLSQAENQLNYFRQTAMPQAEVILRTANLQRSQGEIDYFRYLQSITAAIQLKTDYLSSLNAYNQVVIQLEFYR